MGYIAGQVHLPSLSISGNSRTLKPVPGALSRESSASMCSRLPMTTSFPFRASMPGMISEWSHRSVLSLFSFVRTHSPSSGSSTTTSLRPVLEMSETADLLPAAPRKDADAVREDDVLLLPFLAFALE